MFSVELCFDKFRTIGIEVGNKHDIVRIVFAEYRLSAKNTATIWVQEEGQDEFWQKSQSGMRKAASVDRIAF